MKLTLRLLGALAVIVVIMFATNGYAHHAQFYVIDGFGGVHAGGGAAAPPAGIPYFGFDIAKDIAYIPHIAGDGIMVLDGFGGIHTAGLAGVAPLTPYFGFDIARALTYRNIPARLASNISLAGNTALQSSTFIAVDSVSITAPDDGSVLVICNFSTFCSGCNATTAGDAWVGVGLDALSTPRSLRQIWYESQDGDSVTWSETIPVTAGAHTINCLARDGGQVQDLTYFHPTVSALFIDHTATGTSLPEGGNTGPIGR